MNAVASGVAGEFRAEGGGENTVNNFGVTSAVPVSEPRITSPFALQTGRTVFTPDLGTFFSTVSKKVNDIKELKALLPKYQIAHENLVLLLDAFIERLHSDSIFQAAQSYGASGVYNQAPRTPAAEGVGETPPLRRRFGVAVDGGRGLAVGPRPSALSSRRSVGEPAVSAA